MNILKGFLSRFRISPRKGPSPDHDTSALNRAGTFFFVISKESVLNKDVSKFERFVDSVCLVQLANGVEEYATAVLSIDGYNSDPRSLWQIPEVQEWFKALHMTRPYAPFFLSPASIQIYIACLEPFLPEFMPEDFQGNDKPVVYFLAHAMTQFQIVIHKVLTNRPDKMFDRITKKANERVFSAFGNLMKGKAEIL